MAVVTEWHDISSNPDEEIVCIPKPQLQLLHDENLALFTVMQAGFHGRVQPLKAPFEVVSKLTIEGIKSYVASFTKTIPS